MSSLLNRSVARVPTPETSSLPLVPPEIHARYAAAMAQIPPVNLSIRPTRRSATLPAVGSFG
jgi:hypothetical protein